MTARQTIDPVTGRKYVADSGSAVVLDATNGRVVAMASYPTYDPDVWVGGITQGDLDRLYSAKADTPLLSRADAGPVRAGLDVQAVHHGRRAHPRLHARRPAGLLVVVHGGRPGRSRTTSRRPTATSTFAQALQVSCDTFFYRVGYAKWLEAGGDSGDSTVKDPLVENAKTFGFGRRTGIDLPGEVAGRIADRKWKLSYWKANKDYYCKLGKESRQRLHPRVRPRVLHRRLAVPGRRRGQLRHRPGRHAS